MELIDYFRLLRKYYSVVILTIVITAGVAVLATSIVPKTYSTTVILQSNQNFNIPTYSNASATQQNMNLNNVVGIINQPQFKKEVIGLLRKQKNKLSTPISSFSISAQLINESNLIELKVDAQNSPIQAKTLAVVATSILIDKNSKVIQDRTNYLIQTVKIKISDIDGKLAVIRKNLRKTMAEKTKDQINKEIRTVHIQDQLDSTIATRKTYNDFIDRLVVNNVLTKARLQLVYPAAVPTTYASPKMSNNLMLSLIVGLMLGVALVSFFGKKES